MIDRGIIKWAPFNSVVPTKKIVNEIVSKKNKISMPILSEDQIQTIIEEITTSYHSKSIIKIKYYYNGMIKYEEGKINYIDTYKKMIWINNKNIYLSQIICTTN